MHKANLGVLSLVLFLVLGLHTAKAQDTFRGIVPFVTTRAEVEKMMSGQRVENSRYEFEDGRASILYRESVCEGTVTTCFCLAPIGTVLLVRFEPYSDIKLQDLKLDLKLWQRHKVEGHVPGLEIYVNEKSGITYSLDGAGHVDAVTYRGSEETCRTLKNRASRNQGANLFENGVNCARPKLTTLNLD